MHQAAQAAKRPRRSGHEACHLAGELGQRLRPLHRPRHPIDGVLEYAGDRAVVFRRGDEQPVMGQEQVFELAAVFRQALAGLEVAVVDRQRVVAQVDERDFGAGVAGAVDGDADQLLVE